jgi:hypothetical protein
VEPVPPLWLWFPVTALAATIAVAVHVDVVARRHGRSEMTRLGLAALGALVVAGPVIGMVVADPGSACVDNEWSSVRGGTSDLAGNLLLGGWFTAVAGVYAAAGAARWALVAPVLVAAALVPPVAVESMVSWTSLDALCSGDGRRALVVHLAIAAMVPIGACVFGLLRPRWHPWH